MKLLTLADLEATWPIKRDAIAGHIKAGRLRAYDFSMCGKGPYGVRPEDAERFLEEHLRVALPVTSDEPRPYQYRARRRTARHTREAHESRSAAENASYRI